MASKVEISNRALLKLGAERITSLTENSVNARACNFLFEPLKLSELRKHTWSFAVSRASIAADSTAPLFGKSNSYQLPSDWIRLLPPDPEYNLNSLDWQIEKRKIYTNDSAPLEVRYIYDVTDPNEMDALFREAFASIMAHELCEQITQSNTKKARLLDEYTMLIRDAKRVNAIERVAQLPPEDEWVTIRD